MRTAEPALPLAGDGNDPMFDLAAHQQGPVLRERIAHRPNYLPDTRGIERIFELRQQPGR
jgi:hypothetical protein